MRWHWNRHLSPNPNPSVTRTLTLTLILTLTLTLTLTQVLHTIRNNELFTTMKSVIQRDPENSSRSVLSFIGKLSPVMAEAVEKYGVAILRYMYEEFQVV